MPKRTSKQLKLKPPTVESKLDKIDTKMDLIDTRLGNVETHVSCLDQNYLQIHKIVTNHMTHLSSSRAINWNTVITAITSATGFIVLVYEIVKGRM
jgi:hypothetical protein